MKQPQTALSLFAVMFAAPLLAQPTIGGGACSSSTIGPPNLSGIYAVTMGGRGVSYGEATADVVNDSTGRPPTTDPTSIGTATPFLSYVMEAVGTATFDGLSKVVFTMTEDTNTATGTPLNWSGTYTVQSNCAGTVSITSGGGATFNLAISNTGASFTLTGADSTYAYQMSGNTQATGCSTSTLSGVYVFSATNGFYALTKTGAAGAGTLSGLFQFDGQGNVLANATASANAISNGVTGSLSGLVFTGTYSLGSNCLGSAVISNPAIGSYNLYFSVYSANSTVSTDMFFSAASNPASAMSSGNAYWIYALPTATPGAVLDLLPHESGDMLVQQISGQLSEGGRL
jgi:hypothetical protein